MLLTFGFGLVHGMGFAGALGEIGLPQQYFISSLLSFNLGVEAGQMGIVFVVLPMLLQLRKYSWYRYILLGASSAIFCCSLLLALGKNRMAAHALVMKPKVSLCRTKAWDG